MSASTDLLRQLADAVDQGAPCPTSISSLDHDDPDWPVGLQYDNADISWWAHRLGGTLAFRYVVEGAESYAMHEVMRTVAGFAGRAVKAWVIYDLQRETVGADGCGCPVTDLLYANGSSVPGERGRTEHGPRCPIGATVQAQLFADRPS